MGLDWWLPTRCSMKCPKELATSQVRRCGCVHVQEVVARLGFTMAVRVRVVVLEKGRPWAVSTSVRAGHGHGKAMAWPRRWCNAMRTNDGGLQGGTRRVGSLQAKKIGRGAMAFYGRFIGMSPAAHRDWNGG